ncbi:hypothetical protein VP01_4699g1 [Puccinia sorghi]|uniref:Uncharacterized protein n=1 Tax=Puccinia sorghi TaxID=27349 RepID=A0A0L6UN25_9BASI|nr:hypothetical protein VP01_4699g1 [Puccinia sorghi]
MGKTVQLKSRKSMDPPPSEKFRTMHKLVEFVGLWAWNHGYGISKGSSHTTLQKKTFSTACS